MSYRVFVSLLLVAFCCISCSLQYGANTTPESSHPEFVFEQAQFERIENNQLSIQLQAQKIERYKDANSAYAKGVIFTTYDKNNQKESEGSCNLLEALTQANEYSFFDAIDIYNYKQQVRILASSLHWNSNTEQLTSAKDDTIKIQNTANGTNSYFAGKDFSASTISNTFTFASSIHGRTINDQK